MKHHGQTVEYIIRKRGHNISDLAKSLNVSRRTLYNWFSQPRLRLDIIYSIGNVIGHNFSVEFPEMFLPNQFEAFQKHDLSDELVSVKWKDKYMALLEKYNSELLNRAIKLASSNLFNTPN
jgi:lambda repressor-like predicted transcriptional regulator